jgi:hypothetical protein
VDWTGTVVEWDDKKNLGSKYNKVLNAIKDEKLSNGLTARSMKDEIEKAFEAQEIIHCFIVKNPYNFMKSRLKRNKDLATEMKDWNERIKSYFEFDYDSHIILSYEKLNRNPKGVLEDLSDYFGLEMNEEFVDTEDNLTHAMHATGKRQVLSENYEKEIKSTFSTDVLKQIDGAIDPESLRLYHAL